MNIDITELLESYVDLLEKSGIPKESTESKLMLEAKAEIERLQDQLSFQIKLADDNNNSRLRLLDVIGKGRDLYEGTCKSVREETVSDCVCGMCKHDCDHGLDGYANECPGFEKNDCFELNINKYNDIVFEKKDKAKSKERIETESHDEKHILKGCLSLIDEMVDRCKEWYEFVHGEGALEELSEEDRFGMRMSYSEIVQTLFLAGTTHSGGTSTRQKCKELGITENAVEFGFEQDVADAADNENS